MEKTELAPNEYCGQIGQMRFAGIHLIVELWGACHMTEPDEIRRTITDAVYACGATLLSLDLHVFSPNGGVSGVAVLQESHISIHSWPEFDYAAMDIFVCGTIDPYPAVDVIKSQFQPRNTQITEIKRGIF